MLDAFTCLDSISEIQHIDSQPAMDPMVHGDLESGKVRTSGARHRHPTFEGRRRTMSEVPRIELSIKVAASQDACLKPCVCLNGI